MEDAQQFDLLADEHAAAVTSGIRYHPTVGVVTERDRELWAVDKHGADAHLQRVFGEGKADRLLFDKRKVF